MSSRAHHGIKTGTEKLSPCWLPQTDAHIQKKPPFISNIHTQFKREHLYCLMKLSEIMSGNFPGEQIPLRAILVGPTATQTVARSVG